MLQSRLRCSRLPSLPETWLCNFKPSSTRKNSSNSSNLALALRPSALSAQRKRRKRELDGHWDPPPFPKLGLPKRTVCIKGWTPFANMVEVFAVLRNVELKFGSIVEYRITKDFEMPDKPFAMIFAAFADPASFKLVPPSGMEMAIPAPAYKHKPGGVGWDDIENYLSEADRDPDFERNHDLSISDRPGHVRQHIYVRVSHSKQELNSFGPPPDKLPSPEMQRQIAEKFLKWGETLSLTPISSKRPILDSEFFGDSSLSNVRTRVALRWAANALNKRSPHEIYPEDQGKGACHRPEKGKKP